MAKTEPKADTAATDPLAPVEVRVLTECAYGQANDVAVIPAGELAEAKGNGLVDDNADAVAYAKSLQA